MMNNRIVYIAYDETAILNGVDGTGDESPVILSIRDNLDEAYEACRSNRGGVVYLAELDENCNIVKQQAVKTYSYNRLLNKI